MNIRINKYISEAGICSRRDADRKILAGKVRMNGRPADLGDMVGPDDKVSVDGNLIATSMQRIYLAYNKPMGITSTTDKTDPDNIIKAVAYHGGRIFPVGRLDKDSEGLILLTNDGDIVNKILRVSNKHDKEYIVSVDRKVTDDLVRQMSNGVSILGIMTRKCTVDKINDFAFRIILNQGLNRQIRRMCKELDYKVTRLQRIRIMNIKVDGIAPGTWRFLTDEEIDKILTDIGKSKSEGDVKTRSTGSKSGFAGRSSKPGETGTGVKTRSTGSKSGVAGRSSKPGETGTGVKTRSTGTKSGVADRSSKPGETKKRSSGDWKRKSEGETRGSGGKPRSFGTKPGSSTRPDRSGQKPKTGRGRGTGRGTGRGLK